MMGKQFIFDLVVVLGIPLVFVGGYYFFNNNTLSLSPAPPAPTVEPGLKTKEALLTLKSIKLSNSLFSDPAFLSLKLYVVEIPSVPIFRPNPFIPPAAILQRLRQAAFGIATKPALSGKVSATSLKVQK